MAATLYTSKYLCLNILSTDVKDGQIHLSIMKILIGLLNTKMIGNYPKDSRSLNGSKLLSQSVKYKTDT